MYILEQNAIMLQYTRIRNKILIIYYYTFQSNIPDKLQMMYIQVIPTYETTGIYKLPNTSSFKKTQTCFIQPTCVYRPNGKLECQKGK